MRKAWKLPISHSLEDLTGRELRAVLVWSFSFVWSCGRGLCLLDEVPAALQSWFPVVPGAEATPIPGGQPRAWPFIHLRNQAGSQVGTHLGCVCLLIHSNIHLLCADTIHNAICTQ